MLYVRIALQRPLIKKDNFPEVLDVYIYKNIIATFLPMSESIGLLLELALRESIP